MKEFSRKDFQLTGSGLQFFFDFVVARTGTIEAMNLEGGIRLPNGLGSLIACELPAFEFGAKQLDSQAVFG